MASLLDASLQGDVKVLAVDGVYPTAETIADGSYPFITNLYAVTRSNDHNPNIDALINWLFTPEGRKALESSGLVPVAE